MSVTIGDSSVVTINQSDWPESQWVVSLSDLPMEDKLKICVKCVTAEAELWVEPGYYIMVIKFGENVHVHVTV